MTHKQEIMDWATGASDTDRTEYFARLAWELDKATNEFLCAALDNTASHLASNEYASLALAYSRLARCLSILDHRRKGAA